MMDGEIIEGVAIKKPAPAGFENNIKNKERLDNAQA